MGPTSKNHDPEPGTSRIFLRDHVRHMEIGAFQSERGVLQRVRFNVSLDVASHEFGSADHVDRVLSYDWICESIDHVAGHGRVDLLETFAARLTERLLADPRAESATVRMEKLDRVPGALGVEIRPKSGIICVEAHESDLPLTGVDRVDRRIRILAIEQNAWRLAARDERCSVIDSRTELEHAVQHDGTSVWAPTRHMLDFTGWPEDRLGLAQDLAVGLARKLSVPQVVRCGTEPGLAADPSVRVAAEPEEL